jgi:3-keto-disaccharide hydrolase
MRFLWSALIAVCFAPSVRGEDPPGREAINDGWTSLFDGKSTAGWRIDGDHEITDGSLILGGSRTTRARILAPAGRGFEIRFHYRTEGKDSSCMGWDQRSSTGTWMPGVAIALLVPKEQYSEAYLQEYFDFSAMQRLIKHPVGANGVPGVIEQVWIEVPAGNKLFLRNMRIRYARAPWWTLFVGLSLLVAATAFFYLRRPRRKRAPALTPITSRDETEVIS